MRFGLYLDLAVGTHPHGAETWAERALFAPGISLGAPPDAFSPQGQTWGVAPFSPRALAAEGFAALAETIRAQVRFAGLLRIDHILGFERAFWVPEGLPGLYVAMPREAMLAVVRIEAARAGASVVPIAGQKPGTSGLRKKTRVFMGPATWRTSSSRSSTPSAASKGKTLVLGGDGRYFNDRAAIQVILKMAAASGARG
jgi:hypothetical protein